VKSFGSEAGQALVLVVMITLLILLMSFSTLTLVSECRKASFAERTMVQAYYIADAGVERALAKVKSDSDWLWYAVHLDPDKEVEFIANQNYAGGVIASVKVKEDSIYPTVPLSRQDVAYTDILITSEGTYENSKKTLKVRARVNAPLQFARGVWVNSPDSEFGNSVIISDVTSSGDLIFRHNCTFHGEITAGGTVTVSENVAITTDEVKTAKSIILENNAQVNGRVRQAGINPCQVALAGGALIGRVEEVGGQDITHFEDIYYNGTLLNNSGNVLDASKLHPGRAGVVTTPPYPVLALSMYEKDYDVKYTGNKTFAGDFEINGITYVTGDVTISGNYSGVGAIVAGGNVNISGDLKRYHNDPASSLSILCFGSEGITIAGGKQVWALLYTPPGGPSDMRMINVGNAATVHGSLICDKIVINSAADALVQYENSLAENQPDWITAHINIISWQEFYPVFSFKQA